MTKDTRRKIAFYVDPGADASDAWLCKQLDKMTPRQRTKAMRTMLLAGAALGVADERTASVLAALLGKRTTRDDVLKALEMLLPVDVAGVPQTAHLMPQAIPTPDQLDEPKPEPVVKAEPVQKTTPANTNFIKNVLRGGDDEK